MPIMFYRGKILFRNGAIAMSPSCCCPTTFFPCCSSADVTIQSDTEYAILNDDPTVLANGWVLISDTLRPDGKKDVHCFIVACNQPPGPGYYYIETRPGTLDPATGEVECGDTFIADVQTETGEPITLEGETGDLLDGKYYITATCVVQTQCSWRAERNTDGDLQWVLQSGVDCTPPDYPPTSEGQVVIQ
jgi:hypothetical protein